MGLDGLNEILLQCSRGRRGTWAGGVGTFGTMVLFANSSQGMSLWLSDTSVGILDNSL